ncbi:hypothetical protein BAE44_0007632 [Dichanthelium oligosanthes]|uniref:Uncharacterized protein n=1 Tax=Dichanthelium oligosanthes TaxID=888268 RepID=A0A1E5W1V6_9POAL|nr:hypothetical protein BAE44_0007632 [Dichanthelium oligosanthes]
MDRASVRRPIAVATALALHLLAALHGAGPCAASARPLVGRLPVAAASTWVTTTSALAPAAMELERKWLPFAGAHHLPAAYWAHKPLPWVGLGAGAGARAGELGGGAAGAVEGGEGEEEEVVRERDRERRRQRPSYEGDGATTTRQEQLAMWASLLNPEGRGRSAATAWLPAPGVGEAADDEPAKAADATAVEGAEVDEPSAADQNYWGNNGN